MSVAQTLAIVLPICAAFLGVVLSVVWYLGSRIDRLEDRLGRIEERLTAVEVTLGRIEQRLDDHVSDHPGPTERLVRS